MQSPRLRVDIMSAPTTPSNRVCAPDSPSETLARARAALLLTPALKAMNALTSPPSPAQSSPASTCSVSSTPLTPPSTKSLRTSPSSLSPSPKRIHSAFSSPIRRTSEADKANDWRGRAQHNGIKVSSDNAFDSLQNSDKEDSPRMLVSPSHRSLMHSSSTPHANQETNNQVPTDVLFTTPPRKPSLNVRSSFTDPNPRTHAYDMRSPTTFAHEGDSVPYRGRGSFSSSFSSSLSSDTSSPSSDSNSISQNTHNSHRPRFPSLAGPTLTPCAVTCTVCGAYPSASARLSVLEPCHHVVCSACLTGSLNIVREKDVTCVLCRAPVQDFTLFSGFVGSGYSGEDIKLQPSPHITVEPSQLPKALWSPGSGSAFVPDVHDAFLAGQNPSRTPIVVRVDNVPWDVTPPMLAAWARQPIIGAYTLIDRQSGKTFSHAFIEFTDIKTAQKVLRLCQNSVLGSGKRTMAVTVTMASEEELMTELFPSWPCQFDGNQPILTGAFGGSPSLYPPSVLSHDELDSLLLHIRNPNPRFVKTPALPFYELISIVNKLPADPTAITADVRVHLFDMCSFALALLRQRVLQDQAEIDVSLLCDLQRAVDNCEGFSHFSSVRSSSFARAPTAKVESPRSSRSGNLIKRFADEFNIHPCVVASLANRLAAL